MCDSVAVARSRSLDDVVLFAKNSDRPLGECQPFVQQPAALHAHASQLRCTHIEIPQVAETYRVMGHSPWWVWGFEHGVNEHAVAIGNHTVFSREPVEEKPGLIGMDLVRLGLERGRSARESLEVMAALLEKHGQGGAAFSQEGGGYHNSFLIADPNEIWELETSGRRWGARLSESASVSNHIRIRDDWKIASRDLETFARAEGWWRGSGRVDIQATYRNEQVPGRISEGRLRRARQLLDAEEKHDTASLMRLLRDHGEPLDRGSSSLSAPPVDATPDEERYFSLCMHSEPVGTTTASMVAPLPLDCAAPWPVWVSFASPCTGIFLPVYLQGTLPAEFAAGGEQAREASAWWGMHALSLEGARDFERITPELRKAWSRIEASLESERVEVEAAARRATISGDEGTARELLSDFMQRSVDSALSCARELVRDAFDLSERLAKIER